MTPAERCEFYGSVEMVCWIIATAIEHKLTDEEIAFLASADVETVHQIVNFEWASENLSVVEDLANRMQILTAHDKMRLAAFRAKNQPA